MTKFQKWKKVVPAPFFCLFYSSEDRRFRDRLTYSKLADRA